jgi:hypothetical protein
VTGVARVGCFVADYGGGVCCTERLQSLTKPSAEEAILASGVLGGSLRWM